MILGRALRRVALALALLAVIAGALGAIYFDHLFPFSLDREPGVLTKFHLALLKRDSERCFAALDRAGVDYRRAPPLQTESGCGYEDAARLNGSPVSYGGSLLLRCPAMLGLLLWERHVLAPAARTHLDSEVRSMRHLGTYACRRIGGGEGRSLSEHASANAIDIAGFTLQDGTSVSLAQDWADDGAKGRFLRSLREGACGIFSVTLSPDYNVAHANHFHLDMGRRGVCR